MLVQQIQKALRMHRQQETPVRMAQPIRDLVWAIESPSLLANAEFDNATSPAIPDASPIGLDQLEINHLKSFLGKEPELRVGRYFERLVLYWLQFIRQVEIVSFAHTIRDNGRTLGEFDVIFRDEQKRLTHWELAVKFYLHLPSENSMAGDFVGPNASDRLVRKVHRIFDHQLALSRIHCPEVELRQAFVKGRIFYHPHFKPPTTLPSYLAPDHLRGVWVYASQLELIDAYQLRYYRILRKPFWLAEEFVDRESQHELLTRNLLFDRLEEHFSSLPCRPVLISQLVDRSGDYSEERRFFVVPDSWPSQAKNVC